MPDKKELRVTSPAFNQGSAIPEQYTCDGKNINPELRIEDIPEEAKTLALLLDDPDAPMGTWNHWLLWDIPVKGDAVTINEDSVPGKEGLNDFNKHHYGGPCPPSGTHRYFFKVYALDKILDLPLKSRKTALENGMKEHILAKGELMGTYRRKNR